MQLRLESKLTSQEYITREAWRDASLRLHACPVHRHGGCGFRSCGSYVRKRPDGLRIARWYCPTGRCTFSIVPDFAATRVAATLAELEDAVVRFETARASGHSVELAARSVRTDIEPAGAVRWMRRRRVWLAAAVALLVGVVPELLVGCELSVLAVRTALGCDCVLVRARQIAAAQLKVAPAPLGFAPLPRAAVNRRIARAHKTGPDPPPADT